MTRAKPVRLYDYLPSGNGYKVRLLLTQIGVRFDRVELDILKGETRTPEFLAKNPNGRIPLLEFDDGRFLAESNAIQWVLAEGTAFLPEDPFERGRVLQWLFFEQYSHEPFIAVLRFWTHAGLLEAKGGQVSEKLEGGNAALRVMEDHLAGAEYFVGERYSIADIALYAYTHVAGEGGFDLDAFPAVRAWCGRVCGQPRHIPITQDSFQVEA